MKACLILSGFLLADEHNVSKYFKKEIILKTKNDLKKKLKSSIEEIEVIEWYYIPTRYSVNKTGDVYLTEFSEKEAEEGLQKTHDFLDLCFKFIEEKLSIKLPQSREKIIEYLKKNYSDVIRE